MKKFNFEKGIIDILILLLFVLNILPFLAPLLAHLNYINESRLIYFIYSFLCHQREGRSLYLFDYQMAWCARDVFMYGTILISLVILRIFEVKKIKFWVSLLLCAPLAIDGTIQLVSELFNIIQNKSIFYESNNLFRMLTGTLFGLGISFWAIPILKKELGIINLKQLSTKIVIGGIIVGNLIVYLILIQIWAYSSINNLPSNFLDSLPKSKESALERCIRAKHSTNIIDNCKR